MAAENGVARELVADLSNVYEMLRQQHDSDDVVDTLTDILTVVKEQVKRQRAAAEKSWREQHRVLVRDLDELLPEDTTAVLVGRNELNRSLIRSGMGSTGALWGTTLKLYGS